MGNNPGIIYDIYNIYYYNMLLSNNMSFKKLTVSIITYGVSLLILRCTCV